jgi:uncharacterized protein GlcG (DUF336 family)
VTDEPAQNLTALLEDAAGELEAVDRTEDAVTGAVEWSIAGRAFASAVGRRAEFRLDPAVAAAALRTPDTSRSGRGGDWVAFSPGALDRHAIDRATAWLASAWRRADGES